MLSVAEAQRKLLGLVRRLPAERIAVEEAAGRVLAEDIFAPTDLPAFSSSTMDGYALGTAQVASLPLPFTLPVVGESRAGGTLDVSRAGAWRIFTGAQIPEGADAVVPQELVVREGDSVRFEKRPSPGACIRVRAADLRAGALVASSGTPLHAAHAGLLGMIDRASLLVTRRPVVSVLSTGDEIRAPGQPGSPSSIPDASGIAVRSLLRGAGAIVRAAGPVRDDRRATEDALRAALRDADVLVTIGGVSVGDHDHVRPALEAIGARIDFWRIAMKPGKPLVVSTLEDKVILGLPGNPASAMVTLALFGLPLLRALAGRTDPLPRASRARLTAAVTHEAGRLEMSRASLCIIDGVLSATVLPNQASGALTSLAAADGLLALSADVATFAAGTELDAYPWAELIA